MVEELDLSLLPEELRHLGPLISRYAEGDDVARSELLERASDDELRGLSEAPSAHWSAINAFLDENIDAEPGPLQDLALAVDSFSQAAMEASSTLDARSL
jgi:cell division protein FtsI/penicillin-binding protein 2